MPKNGIGISNFTTIFSDGWYKYVFESLIVYFILNCTLYSSIVDNTEVDNNVDIESNWDKEVETFDDLNLNMDLLRGIYAYGFEKPSVIQQKAILPVLEGHDTIAQAQSGRLFRIVHYI